MTPHSSKESDVMGRVLHPTADWFTSRPVDPTWLLRDSRSGLGVFRAGKVGFIVAEGGVGKTLAVIALALAVATGSEWLGTFTVGAPGRVMMLLGEEDADEVRRRMFHVARAMRLTAKQIALAVERIEILPLAGVQFPLVSEDLKATAHVRELAEHLDAHGPWTLLIVDPLARFAGRAEETSAGGTAFVQVIELIASIAGGASGNVSVMCPHHSNKAARDSGDRNGRARRPSVNDSRGSSSLTDAARWTAILTREDGGAIRFSVIKTNYAATPAPVLLIPRREHEGALTPATEGDLARIQRERDEEKAARVEERRERAEEKRDAKAATADAACLRILTNAGASGITATAFREAMQAEGIGHGPADAARVRLGSKVGRRKEGKSAVYFLADGRDQ